MYTLFYTRQTPRGDIGLRIIYPDGTVEYCSLNNFNEWSYSCLSRDSASKAIRSMRYWDKINGYEVAELIYKCSEVLCDLK